MRCPFCKDNEKMSRVIDSRGAQDSFVIRRRRECLNENCSRRFTSYERIEELSLRVIKKNENREPFDADKIQNSLDLACRKLGIESDKIVAIVKKIETEIRDTHEREVSSRFIGQLIMRELRSLNYIAYVRYASVYKDIRDITELLRFMKPLMDAPPIDESNAGDSAD
jgi:transcriptional repressor NrdR